MDLLKRIGTWTGIFSALAAASAGTLPLHADVQAKAVGVITPTGKWPVEELLANVTPADQDVSSDRSEVLWKQIRKSPYFQVLPDELKWLIEQNKANYKIPSDVNVETFRLDQKNMSGVSFVYVKDQFGIDFAFKSGFDVLPMVMKYMRFVDLPQETPAVNPKTKKPYVFPTAAQIKKLDADDLAYVKAFTETVNRNIHYLGSTPTPRLDPKDVKAGKYIGTSLWPLSLVQPKTWYEGSKKYRRQMVTTHTELVKFFAAGDEQVYALQDQLGTPFYNPQTVAPKAQDIGGVDCFGQTNGSILEVPYIILRQVSQVDRPQHIIGHAYRRYFDAAAASCKLMREGMAAELSGLSAGTPRYQAVAEVVKQAEKYLDQIEGNARAQSAHYTLKEGNPQWWKVPENLLTGQAKAPKASSSREKTSKDSPSREKTSREKKTSSTKPDKKTRPEKRRR